MVSKARNSSQDLRLHTFKLLLPFFFFFKLDSRSYVFFSFCRPELIFSLKRQPQHPNRLLIFFLLWIVWVLLTPFCCVFIFWTWLRSFTTWLPSSRPSAFVIVHGPLTPSCRSFCSVLDPSAVVYTLWWLPRRNRSHIAPLPHPTLTLENHCLHSASLPAVIRHIQPSDSPTQVDSELTWWL